MRELYTQIAESKADNLIAGSRWTIDHKGVTLAAGQGVLLRGTVLGIVSASGEAVPVDSSKSDGSERPDCILAEEVDTTTGPTTTVAYSAGGFIRASLVFGGSDTWEKHELEMRKLNMHLSASIDEKGGVH